MIGMKLIGSIDWNAVTAVSTTIYALLTLALIITGIYGIKITVKQLEESRAQAKIRNLEEQIQQFESPKFETIRKALAEQRIERGKLKALDIYDAPIELDLILDYFEHMALLYRMKYLDLYPIWHTFSYWMFTIYADAREYIEQKRRYDKASLEDFCYLIEELRRVEKEHGSGWDTPSIEEKFEFYEWEARNLGKPLRKRKRAELKKADVAAGT